MKTTGYNSAKSWGVAVACSFMNCMILIPWKTCPMLFVAFVDRYETDRWNASLFIIISIVIRCLAGPVIGYIGQIIDLKYLCISGCLLASFGTGICFFAEEIMFVTISLGIIYGIGATLEYTLLPQIIKQHFTKNIAVANGVALLGACIGMFAIVPLISFLLSDYGVSGGLLLISGIMLQGLPLAMLLGNPKYKNEASTSPAMVSQGKEAHQSTVRTISTEKGTGVIDPMNFEKAKEQVVGINTMNGNVDQVKTISCREYNKANYVTNDIIQCKNFFIECKQNSITNILKDTAFNGKPEHETEPRVNSVNIVEQNPLYKDSEMNKKEGKYRKALKTFRIFKNPTYIVIMICQSLHGYVGLVVYPVIIDISRDKGIVHSQEHFLLMSLLISEAVGYTCLGWVTDKGFLSVANFMSVVFLFMGLSCCSLVFANGFFTMMFACFSFSLLSTVISSVNPALVYEFVEDEKQTMAIASRVVLVTPLSFTVSPVIGYFRGTLGSYNGALYLLTAISLGCSVLLVFLPSIARFTNRNK